VARRPQDDFNAEVQAHIELEAERLRSEGMSDADALATARRAFGNQTAAQERFYDARRWVWLEYVLQDLRLAARLLARTPGWTAVAALTAAVGIGATVAIFSIVDTVLLRPLPFKDPQNLYWVTEKLSPPMEMVVGPDYLSMRDHLQRNQPGLASLAAYDTESVSWSSADTAEQWTSGRVTASFFQVLDVQPLYGRVFRPEEDRPDATRVAVLSYSLWKRRFGGDPNVIGTRIRLNRELTLVTGIMPRGFDYPRGTDLWIPLAMNEAEQRARKGMRLLNAVGRAAPNAGLAEVNADLARMVPIMEAEYPAAYKENGFLQNFKAYAAPLQEKEVGNVRPALLVFTGAVGLMLLIVCFNVANLMLARATVRRREIAVRVALGAPRARIAGQLITESLLISVLGGTLGLGLAWVALDTLSRSRQFEVARLPQISLDSEAAWFAAGLTVLTGLVFGLAPAFGSLGFSVREAWHQEGRSASGSVGLRRARQALVIAQLGLSLTLLIAAGLLAKSFWGLRNTNPGFQPENLLTARTSLNGPDYSTVQSEVDFFERVTDEAERLPGVDAAALSNSIPPGLGQNSGTFTIEGQPAPPPSEQPRANLIVTSDNYFRTLSVPLLAGREFNSSDGAEAPRVIVVNDTFRRQNFPGGEAVGRRIKFGGGGVYTIVGVVADSRHYGFERDVAPIMFQSLHQQDNPGLVNRLWIIVRTKGDQPGLAGTLSKIVTSLDHDQPLVDISTVEDRISRSLGSRRFNAALLGSFALAAVFLGAIGVYGVMSYLVGLRLHEMGIRLALGARRVQILGMVMREGIAMGALGALLGVGGAMALSRYLATLLFGVSPRDTAVFAGLTIAMLAVALAASYFPGLRAARTDPLSALRHD